ncbi:guanylate kinase [Parasporobacterium paucivorans]|uniref:Guanylate kinase n=1 Tax=Parasporobacterium paucivorans DSM 15970 TaxID=1122934 RepID=A0A1M6F9T9_9FIRM|nr:guanylate kinase [Parasporobacterium paucivorans]SHI94442.1 guanylate kinase [Parasporobacterium paucivorans DSM 15970]
MSKKGILTVISGFAGTGKGTIIKRLISSYGSRYTLSVSATTRKPRPGEIEGKEYFFKSVEEFQEMIEKDELLEHAQYVDNFYGTPKNFIMNEMDNGKDIILEIEIQGALKVKEKYPDTVLVFVLPPSAEELRRRLVSRGTEDEATIQARLARACEESTEMEKYDYIIENGVLDESVNEIHRVIQSEHCRTFRNIDRINTIKEELKSL